MSQPLLTPQALWNYWEGHRRLTLRTLELFPNAELFDYSTGGMRPFAAMLAEILNVEESVMRGLHTGTWTWEPTRADVESKEALRSAFSEQRRKTAEVYSALSVETFERVETDAWGMTSTNVERLFYVIDNEIHHRAQGYVYLRTLGAEPPMFYER